MRYNGIFFDADMTLFDFDAGNRIAVNQLLDEVGYHSPDRFDEYEAVNKGCWAALERGEMNQAELRYIRFRRFFRQYGIDADPDAAADRFLELEAEHALLMPHAEEVARRIAAVKPIALLTNGISSVQRGRLARSPIKDIIVDMIVSDEVGIAKPHPGLFNVALRQLGWHRRETLMIGDGATSDIAGANAAGIDACWLNPAGLPLPKGVHAEYVVADLRDCVPLALL